MFYGSGRISVKYPFTVELKNDSTFTVKTRIEHTDATHALTVKDGNRKKVNISPSDTKAIFRIRADGWKIYGIPADSCWLFLSEPGYINSYSFLAEPGMSYVIAIQDGEDGPIVPLTKDNLLPILGNDPKILKLIDKGKLVKAVELFNRMDPSYYTWAGELLRVPTKLFIE